MSAGGEEGWRPRTWCGFIAAGRLISLAFDIGTGAFLPSVLEPRRSVEQALVAGMREAWIGGVSTRRVDAPVQAVGGTGIPKSQVSRLCEEIDERVDAFLTCPPEGEWPR